MVMAGASVRLNTLWFWQRASAAPLTRESGSSSRHRGSFLLDSTRHRDTCSADIATAFRYSGGIPSSATRAYTHASRTAARHGALLLYLLTAWLIGSVLTPSITPGGYVVTPLGAQVIATRAAQSSRLRLGYPAHPPTRVQGMVCWCCMGMPSRACPAVGLAHMLPLFGAVA